MNQSLEALPIANTGSSHSGRQASNSTFPLISNIIYIPSLGVKVQSDAHYSGPVIISHQYNVEIKSTPRSLHSVFNYRKNMTDSVLSVFCQTVHPSVKLGSTMLPMAMLCQLQLQPIKVCASLNEFYSSMQNQHIYNSFSIQ